MGKRKDFSKFEKGHIVMARQLGQGWPVWCNPTDELLLVRLLKKLLLLLIERCQNTQGITV